jgi:hypothetical protein
MVPILASLDRKRMIECCALFVWYNFVRSHKAHKLSPAKPAASLNKLWDMAESYGRKLVTA